jgi:hypothetical protein
VQQLHPSIFFGSRSIKQELWKIQSSTAVWFFQKTCPPILSPFVLVIRMIVVVEQSLAKTS